VAVQMMLREIQKDLHDKSHVIIIIAILNKKITNFRNRGEKIPIQSAAG